MKTPIKTPGYDVVYTAHGSTVRLETLAYNKRISLARTIRRKAELSGNYSMGRVRIVPN